MPGKQFILLSGIIVVMVLLLGAMVLVAPDANKNNAAAIDIEKYVSADNGATWQDADNATGPYLTSGTAPQFKFVINNTGNVDLSDVDVTDDTLGDIWVDGMLTTGSVHEILLTGTWAEGQQSGAATVTGHNRSSVARDSDTANYYGSVPGIMVEEVTNGVDNATVLAGSSITWRYSVTNKGNVPLDRIAVTDSTGVIPAYASGDANANGWLDLNETWVFEAHGIARTGNYYYTSTATGTLPFGAGGIVADNDYSSYFGADPQIIISLVTNNADGPTIPAGEIVVWTYTVKNAGNVPLSNVTVTDVRGAAPTYHWGDFNANGKLDLDETWIYTATNVAIAGVYDDVGKASGSYNGWTATASDPSSYFGSSPTIKISSYVNGDDANTAPGPYVIIGQQVTWIYMINNTGNVPLTNIVVVDDKGAVVALPKTTLAAGESMIAAATDAATAGQHTNTGNVTGYYGGKSVTYGDVTNYYGYDPLCISITTASNGGDGLYIPAGDTVTWTYLVKNTGNVPLANIAVIDNHGVTVILPKTTLAIGESITGTATAVATAGLFENIGTVTGTKPSGAAVTANDPSSYFGSAPGIGIVKTTNGGDGVHIRVGAAVTWQYTVTNTGNVPLGSIAVTDDAGVTPAYVSGDANANGKLDLAEIWVYEATGTAITGSHANTGTASGLPPVGPRVTDDDTSSYIGVTPAIDVEKYVSVDGGATWLEADTATGPTLVSGTAPQFKFVVTNTGDVPLASVTVTDSVYGAIAIPATLAAGASAEATTTGTWAAGQHTNTATASASFTDGITGTLTVSDSDAANYYGAAPAVNLETYISVNDGTTWQDADTADELYLVNDTKPQIGYTVKNTGNVPLANVVVTDTVYNIVGTITTLAPGQSVNLNITNVWKAGQNTSTATASCNFADDGGHVQPVTETDALDYFGADPKISLVKSVNGHDANTAPGRTITIGSAVTWTYVVENIGNVPLTGIVVTDDQLVTPIYVSGDTNANGKLDLTETWIYQATGTATAGQYSNIGTAKGYFGLVMATDSDPAYYFGV